MIAVIAGTGNLPLEACRALIAKKKPFFVIALSPEDNAIALQTCTTQTIEVVTQDLFKPAAILDLLKNKGTTQVLLIGKVDKKALLKKVKMDWLAIKLLATALYKSDAALMEHVVATLASYGIEVIKQNEILDSLFVPPGIVCGTMTEELKANISFGITLAKNISALDIGQTVVVKDLMAIAIEAIEGTDACIKRALTLTHSDIIICKAAQIKQNKKFDLPTLGLHTLAELKQGQVAAIAWDAQHTFIHEQEAFIKKASALNITLVSVAS